MLVAGYVDAIKKSVASDLLLWIHVMAKVGYSDTDVKYHELAFGHSIATDGRVWGYG